MSVDQDLCSEHHDCYESFAFIICLHYFHVIYFHSELIIDMIMSTTNEIITPVLRNQKFLLHVRWDSRSVDEDKTSQIFIVFKYLFMHLVKIAPVKN